MKTFTKWFVMAALMATSAFFTYEEGVFKQVIENDASYISLVCLFTFVGFTAWAGKVAKDIDNGLYHATKDLFHKRLEVGWFAAEHFLTLGLIGTTAGFCYTVNRALGASGNDVSEIVVQLKNGIGRTLYTTITGLICSLLLQIQLFLLQQKIKKS